MEYLPHKEKWLINFSRFGIASKGVVYCILSFLTMMVAMGYSNSEIDQSEVFKTVLSQPFGKILLIILTIGLLGFVVWCIIKAFKDPFGKGNDLKGLATRAGYLWSGMIYLSITILAGKIALNGSESEKGGSNTQMVSKILEQTFGQWMVGIIALGIAGFGIYQIYFGISEKFMKHIQEGNIDPEKRKIYKKAGTMGFIARGIIFLIVAFFFLRAAIYGNASEAKGTEGAFQFIDNSFGPWLLGLMAIGLSAYGLFMFVQARYTEIHFKL